METTNKFVNENFVGTCGEYCLEFSNKEKIKNYEDALFALYQVQYIFDKLTERNPYKFVMKDGVYAILISSIEILVKQIELYIQAIDNNDRKHFKILKENINHNIKVLIVYAEKACICLRS